jgi:hypothetical protein
MDAAFAAFDGALLLLWPTFIIITSLPSQYWVYCSIAFIAASAWRFARYFEFDLRFLPLLYIGTLALVLYTKSGNPIDAVGGSFLLLLSCVLIRWMTRILILKCKVKTLRKK